NKMDMPDTNREGILQSLKETFSDGIVDFGDTSLDSFTDEVAGTDDALMEQYLGGEPLQEEDIKRAIKERKIFPVLFGSALKLQGIERVLCVLEEYFSPRLPEEAFGAIAYKVSVDKQNNRLTHLKITGGTLHAKDPLGDEKANEIRIYSGEKFETVKEVPAGEVCTVTGLKDSRPGTVYGSCTTVFRPQMEPALIYAVHVPEGIAPSKMLNILQTLEDEMPELKVRYKTEEKEFQVMLMGEVQTEVIKEMVMNRHHLEINFGEGKIAYKETIKGNVVGVGHYEPLKHYAEVHLLLRPLERNKGMVFRSNLPVNALDTNWQRLILTHLEEKQHLGVLTGSPITDIEISVLAGRAHLKHTEGGDFRQSTYRAIRQGLMKAESVLLEPFYRYEIVVPDDNVVRVMSDVERMHGTPTIVDNKAGFTTLTGRCPVSTMKNYINDVRAFTRGQGTLSVLVEGYDLCHNSDEVIKEIGYHAEADLENPASSVFCSHGAGFVVPWQEVDNYKHIQLK
ncbi:MAG: TetM/TetW/TetO/TetS family tetracycline resistance ribosomal protection protein, partial [Spirochaetales bacterium]|nr:TetM/TetW/TetO/TetS family tetracycline resistance ribosomal protection protein [Candidatus Physcosoma equi]